MKKNILLNLLSFLFFFSCQNNSIQQTIEMMMEKKVSIDYDKMVRLQVDSCANNYMYRWIIYVDSVSCTPCMFKDLHRWDSLILKTQQNGIKYDFIFSIKSPDVDLYKNEYVNANLFQDVYLDTMAIFSKNNPHIPPKKIFHCFLTDEKGKIELVGNPIYNEKIMKLFFDFISSKYEM